MRRILTMAIVLAACLPGAALSDTATEQNALMRPGDTEGTALLSDGLAECAAILAVASTTASNIVERNTMSQTSAGWFAASGDQALSEGDLPAAEVWAAKVTDWSGRIGSVAGMAKHADWMAYCAGIGAQQGLDSRFFTRGAL